MSMLYWKTKIKTKLSHALQDRGGQAFPGGSALLRPKHRSMPLASEEWLPPEETPGHPAPANGEASFGHGPGRNPSHTSPQLALATEPKAARSSEGVFPTASEVNPSLSLEVVTNPVTGFPPRSLAHEEARKTIGVFIPMSQK